MIAFQAASGLEFRRSSCQSGVTRSKWIEQRKNWKFVRTSRGVCQFPRSEFNTMCLENPILLDKNSESIHSTERNGVLHSLGGKWACIDNCGACCYLGTEERDVESLLSDESEVTEYLSMIGGDGWCIHFDKESRKCTKYLSRPEFCRVDPESFERRYGAEKAEFDQFAIDCCIEHISDTYGDQSLEIDRYFRAVNSEHR